MSPDPPNPSTPDDRLRALEEAQGFAEHNADLLAQEVERAFALMKRLEDRLNTLERRMTNMQHEHRSGDD